MIEALEAKLLKNPNDGATWLVYADALQEKRDPRGEAIALGARIADGADDADTLRRYAERCRAARWPQKGPWPKMHYRVRFEQLFDELRKTAGVTVSEAEIGAPNPDDLMRWRELAGAAWPDGMSELYGELSSVDLEYKLEGADGAIHIPTLSLWDHDALENELWFDFTEEESALHLIRPIDRFVPEAYAVLYLKPQKQQAKVAYHYCGESLTPTNLTYREWLESLFRSRGVFYWLQLATGPQSGSSTWVEEGIAKMANVFPDFDPESMSPQEAFEEIDL